MYGQERAKQKYYSFLVLLSIFGSSRSRRGLNTPVKRAVPENTSRVASQWVMVKGLLK